MNRMLLISLIPLILLSIAATVPVLAEMRLPALFSDGMVLQRNSPVPIWGTAAPGETVSVRIRRQTATATADANGDWRVVLRPMRAGGPDDMTVTGANAVTIHNVLVGEVWLFSGQSNMEMGVAGVFDAEREIAGSTDPHLRLFHVPSTGALRPQRDVNASWKECGPQTVPGFSAAAYFMGRELRTALGVPVGLINSSVGGTPIHSWTSRAALESDPRSAELVAHWDRVNGACADAEQRFEHYYSTFWAGIFRFYEQEATWPERARKAKEAGQTEPPHAQLPAGVGDPSTASCLYNGMIAPLAGYAIRGAAWYQGESDAGDAAHYRIQLPLLIADWRKAWGQGDFEFLIVQLANFMAEQTVPAQKSDWALLREAQAMALSVPHTGMAVAIDVGDAVDIHPRNKQAVGRRLALSALGTVYKKSVVPSGPLFRRMAVRGDQVRLQFRYANGGIKTSDGGPVRGFAIAGADRCFHWAEALIEKNDIIVSCEAVANPVAVRYAWADNPTCNLQNTAGLPAVPFRTDDWSEWTNAE